jgi:ElaB/YqjD/DUF883 family membrane-anchored ribosome-binding protein
LKKLYETQKSLEKELEDAKRKSESEFYINKTQEELNNVTEEIKELLKYINNNGSFVNKDEKKAKDNVEKAIKRTLKAIENKHPEPYKHLDDCLKIGWFCSYSPHDDIEWEVKD